jgi:cytochrome c-type biogenesis protein CcmH
VRALLAVAFLAIWCVALAPPAAADRPSAAALEEEIVCPTCKTTLALSDSPVARRMKTFIRTRIAAGDSEAEVKDKLVEEFGPAVLAEPAKRGFDLLAWALPVSGLAAGAVVLGGLTFAWSRRRGPAPEDDALDPALAKRLDDELDRFDDPS